MKLLSILLLYFIGLQMVSAQSFLVGKITDEETGEEMIGADICLYKRGKFIAGGMTDFDGYFEIEVEAGIYDVEAFYNGYDEYGYTLIDGVKVEHNKRNILDIKLGQGESSCCGYYIIRPSPWDDPYETTSGHIFRAEDFRPLRSIRKN